MWKSKHSPFTLCFETRHIGFDSSNKSKRSQQESIPADIYTKVKDCFGKGSCKLPKTTSQRADIYRSRSKFSNKYGKALKRCAALDRPVKWYDSGTITECLEISPPLSAPFLLSLLSVHKVTMMINQRIAVSANLVPVFICEVGGNTQPTDSLVNSSFPYNAKRWISNYLSKTGIRGVQRKQIQIQEYEARRIGRKRTDTYTLQLLHRNKTEAWTCPC